MEKVFNLEESLSLVKYHEILEKAKYNSGYITEKELHNSLVLINRIYEDFKAIGEKRNG